MVGYRQSAAPDGTASVGEGEVRAATPGRGGLTVDAQPRSIALVVGATRSALWQTRRDAVVELAEQARIPEVRDRLIQLLDDDDLAVVAAAAAALARHGGGEGLDAVIALLEDGPDDAGYAARDALVVLVHQDEQTARAVRGRVGARPPRRAVSPELLVELCSREVS